MDVSRAVITRTPYHCSHFSAARPSHFFPAHEASISQVAWQMQPPLRPEDGEHMLDDLPNTVFSLGLDCDGLLTNIHDPYAKAVMQHTRSECGCDGCLKSSAHVGLSQAYLTRKHGFGMSRPTSWSKTTTFASLTLDLTTTAPRIACLTVAVAIW